MQCKKSTGIKKIKKIKKIKNKIKSYHGVREGDF